MERKQQITARVIQIAAKKVDIPESQVFPESHFINDLNFDSLDVVDMNMLIEDEYDLTIPDEDAQKLLTVAALADYIAENSGKKLAAEEGR
jgi:acyl carrier protein